MTRLYLRLVAPFAAFRWMQAGVYRATSPVIPPSAAWGLVLNLAGVETRGDASGVTTLVRPDAPRLRIAVGQVARTAPASSTLYQQLHGYPVGNSGKELAERTHGAKYWIAPGRRELLVDFDAVLAVESRDDGLLSRVRAGLDGTLGEPRYGLPFAGDNNLLFDRIDALDTPPPTHWYAAMRPGEDPRPGSCRLTVGIDRADSSRTTSDVFAPIETASVSPPDAAWTWTPGAPS